MLLNWLLTVIFSARSALLSLWPQSWRAQAKPLWYRRNWRSRLFLLLLAILTAGSILATPVLARTPAVVAAQPDRPEAQNWVRQGKAFYDAGQFSAAITVLQQAIQVYEAEGDRLRQALTLSNLSLTYQQLGLWPEATQAIAKSLNLLGQEPASRTGERTEQLQGLAQTLNIQGRLQLAQGEAEQALDTWKRATAYYEQAGDSAGAIDSRLNQAQALQALGLYRRAIALLTDLNQSLQSQPNSLTQAVALRSLGNALQVAGDLEQSQQVLEQSLQVLEQIQAKGADNREAIAATQLSLGNLTHAQAVAKLSLNDMTSAEAIAQLNAPTPQSPTPVSLTITRRRTAAAQAFAQQLETTLSLYQQAAAGAAETRVQAELNQLSVLIELQRWAIAQPLYRQVQAELGKLPLSHSTLYSQIALAQTLLKLRQGDMQIDAARLLTLTSQQAAALGDTRAQSYALGSLGNLYEQTQQWAEAQKLTQQALMLSQAINAADISYRWQGQLGRLLNRQGDRSGAIAAYKEAVQTLQALRSDLVAINRDAQFSFRESVEPVYREFVELLLRHDGVSDTSAENLVQARSVIEGLQIAELDNFFREACLDSQFQLDRVVDQAKLPAAVLYTIVLPDRLEVILKLPQQELKHYTTEVAQAEVERAADALLSELKKPYTDRTLQSLSEQMYDWLLRPAATTLATSGVETLVFVLDGALRSIPIAALYDGQHYLIEQYSVALAPGLQLPDPKPLQQRKFRALVAGLSDARDNFPALNHVEQEVEQIQADVPSKVLLNQNFTTTNFQSLLSSSPFSIVHIATHGQFSSNAAETFILAWDKPIDVNELNRLLQMKELESTEPIELLVLSACRTAVGDRRATLGLAGVAVRAGARSTIASLWNLDDDSGAALMSQFYQELVNHPISKAEALRRAQSSLLANPQFAAPRFWAPYVLLGNWL